jgi:hypothetical protein
MGVPAPTQPKANVSKVKNKVRSIDPISFAGPVASPSPDSVGTNTRRI